VPREAGICWQATTTRKASTDPDFTRWLFAPTIASWLHWIEAEFTARLPRTLNEV
jgi:hypothetical protein